MYFCLIFREFMNNVTDLIQYLGEFNQGKLVLVWTKKITIVIVWKLSCIFLYESKRWTVVEWLSYLKKLFRSSWTSYILRDDRWIILMEFSRRTINSFPCSNSPRYWMRSVTLFMNSLKIKQKYISHCQWSIVSASLWLMVNG